MNYVMLHGRAQQGKDPGVLKAGWLNAFNAGRARAGKNAVSEDDVTFPFYGDALDELIRRLEVDDDSLRSRGADPQNTILALEYEIAIELAVRAGVTTALVNEEYKGDVRERGPLNWEWVHSFLKVLDHTKVGDWSIRRFTRDTAIYLDNDAVRDAINELVAEQAAGEQPSVWITHSMGSIIAYDVLAKNPGFEVPQFVTLGSPLGVNAIRKRLASPLQMPTGVTGWSNFYDERDVVPLYPLQKSSGWNLEPPIQNFAVTNTNYTDPHDILGYLGDLKIIV